MTGPQLCALAVATGLLFGISFAFAVRLDPDLDVRPAHAIGGADHWTPYRTSDPIRAAALHEAVVYSTYRFAQMATSQTVLQIAEEFERWLAGTDEDAT